MMTDLSDLTKELQSALNSAKEENIKHKIKIENNDLLDHFYLTKIKNLELLNQALNVQLQEYKQELEK